MNHKQLAEWYSKVEKDNVHTNCDMNKASIQAIRTLIQGPKVLDVACGLGYLSQILANDGLQVTAADFVISKNVNKHPNIRYKKVNIEELPFDNNSFDTTISAHTLEHTLNIQKAISELRRVTSKKLIIILPKERPYKSGCNFHTYFFPYEYSIYQTLGYNPQKQTLSIVGGDWLYTEQLQ